MQSKMNKDKNLHFLKFRESCRYLFRASICASSLALCCWPELVVEMRIFSCFAFDCFHHRHTQLQRRSPELLDSAPLVFQNVQSFLVLCLKCHDEVVRGDLTPTVLVHLAHEDVVQAWQGHTKKT